MLRKLRIEVMIYWCKWLQFWVDLTVIEFFMKTGTVPLTSGSCLSRGIKLGLLNGDWSMTFVELTDRVCKLRCWIEIRKVFSEFVFSDNFCNVVEIFFCNGVEFVSKAQGALQTMSWLHFLKRHCCVFWLIVHFERWVELEEPNNVCITLN